jgi:hypothetical protein
MSKPHRLGRLAGPFVILACSFSAALAQGSIETGTLASGDRTLASGQYYDEYQIEAREGDIVAFLMSYDFDPYLILIPPAGDSFQNDDFGGSSYLSRLEVPVGRKISGSNTVPAAGTWKVRVTSHEPGETGEYALLMGTRKAGGDDATAPEDEPEEFTVTGSIALGDTVDGTLDSNDDWQIDGSFYEAYALEVPAATSVVITMESDNVLLLDPFLLLVSPSGEFGESNDDVEEGNRNARIETTMSEAGRWLVVAAAEPEQTGAYHLTVTRR